VLDEKVLQLELSARTSSAFQQARRRALPHTVLLGRAAIFGHEENDGLQDNPRAGRLCGERGDGREEPTRQLHTCLEGKAIEEIGDSSIGLVGTTRTEFVGLVTAVLTLAATFFFDFPAAG